jgi:hypothetical protein
MAVGLEFPSRHEVEKLTFTSETLCFLVEVCADGDVRQWLFHPYHFVCSDFILNATFQPLYPGDRDLVPIVQEAGWSPGTVWTGAENLAIPPGLDPWTVQPVGCSCTDSAHQNWVTSVIFFRSLFLITLPCTLKGKIEIRRRFFTQEEFIVEKLILNPLTPNDPYMGRTAPLTPRRCILCIQQIYVLNILNMLHILRFFLFKMPFVS